MPALAIIVPIVEAIFKYAPGAVVAIRKLFEKDNPTPADWDEFKSKLQSADADYAALVPDSKIPK